MAAIHQYQYAMKATVCMLQFLRALVRAYLKAAVTIHISNQFEPHPQHHFRMITHVDDDDVSIITDIFDIGCCTAVNCNFAVVSGVAVVELASVAAAYC